MDAEVEVGTRGEPRGTDIADDLFLLHRGTYLDAFGKTGKVHIRCHVNTVMLDFDVIATAVCLVALGNHLAAADGIDGGARGGGIVHAVMGAVALQDGMVAAVGETGGDAVEVQRRFQEGSLHRTWN